MLWAKVRSGRPETCMIGGLQPAFHDNTTHYRYIYGSDVEIDNGTRRQAPSTRAWIYSRSRADFLTRAALPVAISMPPGLRT
jgi:hypothetical protein